MASTGCLPALAAAGNDLIVEHIIEFRAWREYLATLPGDLDAFELASGEC
jgi:chloramphenicol 3-O phosphotransferase